MQSVYLIISGDVQGVGYRSWLKNEAQKLNLVGWVKNREDGCVEAVLQGERNTIEEIVKKANVGPDVAWVEKVVVTDRPVKNDLFRFEVIY